MQISVIGLGKVGLSLAACLRAAGHDVVGVDLDSALVDALNQGHWQTPEPGVAERLTAKSSGSFRAVTDASQAARDTAMSFVIVPTPSNALGGFSARFVLKACDQIGAGLRQKSEPHTVAIVSTLLPGSSDGVVLPQLEKASGRQRGPALGYCYNPSFIALGEIVKGIEQPDYVLIGQSDSAAGDLVWSVHQTIVGNGAPVVRMSPAEAEVTKVASNTHETMRVSFANMLLGICSEVPGADVDRITEALAYRMGRRFFKGAVPYGGPCWPRDNQAFSVFMEAVRSPSTLPRAVDTFNDEHGLYVLRKILSVTQPGERVGVLGLAYKPGTPVIERAFAVDLIRWLLKEGRTVIGWDPLATDEVRREIGAAMEYAESAESCLRASTVAVVTIPMPELSRIDWSAAQHVRLVDCWRCLAPPAVSACREYIPLGRGPKGDVRQWLDAVAGDYFRLLTS